MEVSHDIPSNTMFSDSLFQCTRNPDDMGGVWTSLETGQTEAGGLFVPNEFPESFDKDFIESQLPNLAVHEVSAALMRKYIPEEEIGNTTLTDMTKFAHFFDIPLEDIDGSTIASFLDRGPTASFKDFAARIIAQILEYRCEQIREPKNIVVATSGDTGVAIADAFADSKWITVTVLYPADGVSEMQEKQMRDAAKKHANIQIVPMDGNFDYTQSTARTLFASQYVDSADKEQLTDFRQSVRDALGQELSEENAVHLIEEAKDLNLFSANSINIWRLLPQMTQYFVTYGKLIKSEQIKAGDEVVFAVPTGNVGHIMAGFYAKELGLPIKKFVMGTNQNNIMANVIGNSEIYHSGFVNTLAPSMDILAPNNLERMLDYAKKQVDPEAEIDYEGIKKAVQKLDFQIKKRLLIQAVNIAYDSNIENLIEDDKGTVKEALLRLQKMDDAERSELKIGDAMMDFLADITSDDSKIKFADILNVELGNLHTQPEDGIPLSQFGVTDKMMKFLRERIWAEDTVSDDEIGEIMASTDADIESHGACALKATRSARENGFISGDDTVAVFVTAHLDKFPRAKEMAGGKEAKRLHPELDRFKDIDLKDLPRPEVTRLIMDVVKRVREISDLSAENRAA